MKSLEKLCALALLCFLQPLSLLSALVEYPPPPPIDKSISRLISESRERIEKRDLTEEDLTEFRLLSESKRTELAVQGVIGLWMLGAEPAVHLAWWRSSDETVRQVCLAIIICRPIGEIALDIPRREFRKAAARYADPESKSRLKEIEIVHGQTTEYRKICSFIWQANRKLIEGKRAPGKGE